jgi:hypothetical protein
MNPHNKAAEEDNPPTGIEPLITPFIPFDRLKSLFKDKTAPLM